MPSNLNNVYKQIDQEKQVDFPILPLPLPGEKYIHSRTLTPTNSIVTASPNKNHSSHFLFGRKHSRALPPLPWRITHPISSLGENTPEHSLHCHGDWHTKWV